MNLAKLNKILELFWWAMAIVSFIAVSIFAIQEGLNKWLYYYIVPVLAVIMALVRRFMKNKLEKSTQQKGR